MSIYKMFNSFAASADSGASLDIQFDGQLVVIDWNVNGDFDADLERYEIEVSFLSTNTFSSNDSRGSLSQVGARAAAAGTPASLVVDSTQKVVTGLDIPVVQGERVHLHGSITGLGVVAATVYLHVNDRAATRIRRRR